MNSSISLAAENASEHFSCEIGLTGGMACFSFALSITAMAATIAYCLYTNKKYLSSQQCQQKRYVHLSSVDGARTVCMVIYADCFGLFSSPFLNTILLFSVIFCMILIIRLHLMNTTLAPRTPNHSDCSTKRSRDHLKDEPVDHEHFIWLRGKPLQFADKPFNVWKYTVKG